MSGAGVAPIATDAPDAAPPETEAAILHLVVRAYPNCGNQLEAAARMALRLGWAAGRAFPGEGA